MFKSREEAGQLLAEKLTDFKNKKETFVLGIPRGGMVVAKVVADILRAPLDIITVRKIGAPGNPELAIGAVGPKSTVYWDKELCQRLGITKEVKNLELRIKNQEREERERTLRGRKPKSQVKNKTVILVDDGVATGATCLAAAKSLRKMAAKEIILAIPVIARDTLLNIKRYFDEVIFLAQPGEFFAVGQFYEEFPQVEDKEVVKLLAASCL